MIALIIAHSGLVIICLLILMNMEKKNEKLHKFKCEEAEMYFREMQALRQELLDRGGAEDLIEAHDKRMFEFCSAKLELLRKEFKI